MECFFLLVRSSISYTRAWPVFCWAVSSNHALSPCIWDELLLSVSPCSVCTPLLLCLQHTQKASFRGNLQNVFHWGASTIVSVWSPLKMLWFCSPVDRGRAPAGVQRETPRDMWSPYSDWKPPDWAPGSLRDWRWHGWVKEIPVQARGRIWFCLSSSVLMWNSVTIWKVVRILGGKTHTKNHHNHFSFSETNHT